MENIVDLMVKHIKQKVLINIRCFLCGIRSVQESIDNIIESQYCEWFCKFDAHSVWGYGLLPIWPLWSSETNCMIGYHAVPVIVDAYFKGIRGYDVEKAYQAWRIQQCKTTLGWKSWKNMDIYRMINIISGFNRIRILLWWLVYRSDGKEPE